MKYRPTIAQPLQGKMDYEKAALFLGVSVRTLKRKVRADDVPHYRIGYRVYFSEVDLLKWVESCRRGQV